MAKDLLWQHGEQFAGARLELAQVDPDPVAQFRAWYATAAASIPNANAMTLATVDERGHPDARIVLLKEIDDRGLSFFTNYDSAKGRQLAAHPFAALVFYWDALHRQVRIDGAVERVDAAESDAYFASRPRGSQLGAIASPQSQVIAGRELLDERVAAVTAAHPEDAPPRPAYWGGYRVIPERVELWQGQPSRLHDRIRYRRDGAAWVRERLAP
jgi:pyridoxamine 5'-phosphate oxidase